jgi:hypothetical protein
VCSAEQPFALIANGQKVMVTCPPNVRPGQKIRFQLPIQLSQQQLETFKVSYDKDGWMRCLGMVSSLPARVYAGAAVPILPMRNACFVVYSGVIYSTLPCLRRRALLNTSCVLTNPFCMSYPATGFEVPLGVQPSRRRQQPDGLQPQRQGTAHTLLLLLARAVECDYGVRPASLGMPVPLERCLQGCVAVAVFREALLRPHSRYVPLCHSSVAVCLTTVFGLLFSYP